MIFLLVVSMCLPLLVDAQTSPSIAINEIAWMGTSIEDIDANQHWRHEWVELYNTTERSMVLDEWTMELYRGEELYFAIPLSGTILSKEYFLIGASDKIVGVDVNYANLGGKFVNTGMRVVLQDNLGNIVHEIDAKEGWMGGDNTTKRTMEKIDTGWQTSRDPGGTPKEKNSKGFVEPIVEPFSFATKKDPSRSSSDSMSLWNGTTLLAFLLAVGSALLVLVLYRVLSSRQV